jgi:capsular polysaccharide biosynthesis protein
MDNKTINMNDDEVEIDLLQLFRALKKRILWIVGAGVIMGGAFGLFSKFAITPQYTSTSMVYILSKETTLTSLADLRKPADSGLQDHRNQPSGYFRSH